MVQDAGFPFDTALGGACVSAQLQPNGHFFYELIPKEDALLSVDEREGAKARQSMNSMPKGTPRDRFYSIDHFFGKFIGRE
jgi:hypothetical protein